MVTVNIIEINGNPYVGFQRKYTPDGKDVKPEIKGVYLPLQAWTRFANEVIPQMNNKISQYRKRVAQPDNSEVDAKRPREENSVHDKTG